MLEKEIGDKATEDEVIGNAFMRACAKLTSDEMAVIMRALAASQAPVESNPRSQSLSRRVEHALEVKDLEGYLTEEESRIRLHAGAAGLPGVKSALAVSNSGHTGFRGEPRRCYICDEVGHLKQNCPKSPNKRDTGERGQYGGCGCGRGGRRGRRGDYWANLMVEEGESDEILKRKQKAAGNEKSMVDDTSTSSSPKGNFACLAQSDTGICNTLALASIPTTRSPDWIVYSGATRHVTGVAREFSSYSPSSPRYHSDSRWYGTARGW